MLIEKVANKINLIMKLHQLHLKYGELNDLSCWKDKSSHACESCALDKKS